jgi:hypothetical protein
MSIILLVKRGSTMPEFMVAIDHITYYAVQAEDEITAIDLVLEGQGEEISSDAGSPSRLVKPPTLSRTCLLDTRTWGTTHIVLSPFVIA